MNCYQCVHIENVPGNAHVKCAKLKDSQLKQVLSVVLRAQSVDEYVFEMKERHGMEINNHGVKHGWCYWPLLFDPIWVDVCPHFEGVLPEYKPETKGGPK